MKIIAFAGSNSSTSINKKLVTFVASFFKTHDVEILDLNDFEMPVFGVDLLAKNGIHELAAQFAEKIDSSDFLLVSLAENNGAYSTAFKNVYDWVSMIKTREVFGKKQMFLMATSPGARGGATILDIAKNRFIYTGAKIIETFSLPSFNDNFNTDTGTTNNEILNLLKVKIETINNSLQQS